MERYKVVHNSEIMSPTQLEEWLEKMYKEGWDLVSETGNRYIFRNVFSWGEPYNK